MKRISLNKQALIIFSITIIISIFIFILFLRNRLNPTFVDTNNKRLLEHLISSDKNNINRKDKEGYGLIIIDINEYRSDNLSIIFSNNEYYIKQIINYYQNNKNLSELPLSYSIQDKYYSFGIKEDNIVKIAVSNNTYIESLHNETTKNILIIFLPTLVLGNLIILLWSSMNSRRIIKIKNEVEKNNFVNISKLKIEDEISSLAISIFKMQKQISENEKTKQEMLQNISHDFKTPISVIKSYSEAILDNIEDVKSINIILKQTDILKKKVYDLLQLTKLEYLKQEKDLEDVNIEPIIMNIVQNYKHHKNIEIITNLETTIFKGFIDNYYSIVNNIIENALRYVKTKIVITLKNNELSIFNDGDIIDKETLDKMFLPYEKGNKGDFGLGMSIVRRTLSNFNMDIKVYNRADGVEFIIRKRDINE